ncbi:hypothetical protein Leryth_026255 [Lithospermum erythrorhizon]|nr:hypothetical protein Leryth_026255 [Lithospermum erythrorhizon]
MLPSKCFSKHLEKFPNFLIYVILEWSIIFILFIDGIIIFCSNEVARLFGLTRPCLLCTRFDHILVPRNKNFFYNDSICEEHKKNISSLAYCVMHKKLSNIKTMCDGCLLSFASEKNSGCDKYKHLVGTLDKDIETFVEDNKKSRNREEINVQYEKIIGGEKCSCCGETFKPRTSTKYDRSNSIKSSFISQSPIASPRGRLWRSEESNVLRCSSLKFGSKNEANTPRHEEISTGREDFKGTDAAAPVVHDSEGLNEDRTPMSRRANRFFGIPFSESANTTPRFRMIGNLSHDDQVELVPGPNDAGGSMNEMDGDHIINRLKKEVRLDRRSLIELYMELDEERNASAVAADEAMAMITRLQAEKAAMHMEALQYQRMMEEQAEYDQEALQAMKELVLKREDEIDELEFELENYRDKCGEHIKTVDSEVDAEEYHEMKSRSFSSSSEKSHPGSPKKNPQMGEIEHCTHETVSGGFGTQDALAFDFEGERSYLLDLLKNLEKNIEQSSEELPSSSPDRETAHKATLTREMSTIRERLRALEAESGFLRRAAMTIRKGTEGTKLLTEIAEHLRMLRHSAEMPSEEANFS